MYLASIINPQRTYVVRVTAVVLCVCVSVNPYSSKPSNKASYQRFQWL